MSSHRSIARQAIWRLLSLFGATTLVLLATPAHAAIEGCLTRSARFVPSTPIRVPGVPPSGTKIYGGKLVADFTCSFKAPLGTADNFVLVGGGVPVRIPGTAYEVKRVGVPNFSSNGVPDACTFTFDPFSDSSPGQTVFKAQQLGSSPNDSTCTIHADMDLEITYLGEAVGPLVNIPEDSQLLLQGIGWAGIDRRIDSDPMTATAGPIVVEQVTCTLASTNMFVQLPSVSSTELTKAGDTAGEKSFQVALQGCENSTPNKFTVNATWAYIPIGTLPVIENSAPLPHAANVGIQMLDDKGNAIPNGGVTEVATVEGGAVSYTQAYKARYYATGPASAGPVRGVAQLVLSYQ